MSLKYSFVLKATFLSAFYANVIPVGMLFSCGGLIAIYWVDKYLLVRRHCRPRELSKELPEAMADLLEYFLVVFAGGNLIFDRILFGKLMPLNIVAACVAGIYLLLPTRPIVKCISPAETEERLSNYAENEFKFATDYDRENPVTREEAIYNYMEKLMGRMDNEEGKAEMKQYVEAAKPVEGQKKIPQCY
jgi:hypothetical protein